MANSTEHNFGYWCEGPVARHPERVAIIDLCIGGERRLTYRELDGRLNRFANLTRALGLAKGDRLLMSVNNRFEFIEAMYGAMRAGVVPVPLNTRLGADTLDYIAGDSGARAALIEPSANAFIAGVVERRGIAVKLAFDPAPPGWTDYEAALMAQPDSFDPPPVGPADMSFLPYTSGSTGRPKGVVLDHGGQYWWTRCLARYWPASIEDRALAAVPLYHKNAMAGAVKPNLHQGGSVVLLPGFEPRRFLEVLATYRCTHAGGVPAVFIRLLQEKELIASLDFSALKGLKIGSAPVQPELMSAIEQAFGVAVSESYGLTEGGPVMIGPPIAGHPQHGRKAPHGSCGVAWPEGEVKLLNPDGSENPSDGELWVKNPGVTPGYYNLPAVNAKRLVDGWLATGDLFHRDAEGWFYFRGRTDDMFKSAGESVYPKEVENLLLAHPDVADASVAAVAHPVKGAVPVAMVVARRGAEVTEEALKRYCLANGPAYAHPRRVALVAELPLNGAGKVDRRLVQQELERRYAAEIASLA